MDNAIGWIRLNNEILTLSQKDFEASGLAAGKRYTFRIITIIGNTEYIGKETSEFTALGKLAICSGSFVAEYIYISSIKIIETLRMQSDSILMSLYTLMQLSIATVYYIEFSKYMSVKQFVQWWHF